MAIEACGAMAALVRGSIDETVPTHAAAAPAINFALRSSRGFSCQTIFLLPSGRV